MSQNKKHQAKRHEVALFLLGSFAEDISMFRMRNPLQFDLHAIVTKLVLHSDDKVGPLKSLLKGRALWCANNLAEILPRDFDDIQSAVLTLAADTLINEKKLTSLKFVATRSLIKYSRKVKPDILQALVGERFENIVDELANLLDSASLDTVHLPIEAFTAYSRMNEDIVAQMAPKITPKLLKFFRTYHSETSLAQELLNLFKLWCTYDACRDIFVNTFIPFIMEIIEMYYKATPNSENRD